VAKRTDAQVGDPIVIAGDKYRIREVIGDHALYVAVCPKRNPTHRVSFYGSPGWDSYAGVWRLPHFYSLSPIARRRRKPVY